MIIAVIAGIARDRRDRKDKSIAGDLQMKKSRGKREGYGHS